MGVSGGVLTRLTVLSATNNNFITAQLTSATSAPGTYLLVVSRGPSSTDVFSIAITLDGGPHGNNGTSRPKRASRTTGRDRRHRSDRPNRRNWTNRSARAGRTDRQYGSDWPDRTRRYGLARCMEQLDG